VATTDPTPTQAGRLSPEAAGDRLSQLFEEHGRMVYGLCRVLLRDAAEAEDAAQQVFLSAHQSMLGGTEPRDPSAWLAAIARNECHARIRAKMAKPIMLVVDERDAVGADIEQVAGQHAEVEALCAALAELPQQQREAIVLREFYGLSYDEVRTALGVTDGAVESLLFRARERLQAELQPARVASGALALPLALRDSIAAAVPGFSAASSGGGLAKLASLPLFAKLAGAAATVTAAGTIGFVGLEARDHDPASVRRSPAAGHSDARRRASARPIRIEPASFVQRVSSEPTRREEQREGDSEDSDEPEVGNEGESEEVEKEAEEQDFSEPGSGRPRSRISSCVRSTGYSTRWYSARCSSRSSSR
jgi:RNA polymerase sigma factor (sigma-70 family)